MIRSLRARPLLVAAACLLVLLNVLLVLVDGLVVRSLAALALAGFLPGTLLAGLVGGDDQQDRLEQLLLAMGLSVVVPIVGTLALCYLLHPLTRQSMLVGLDVLNIGLLAAHLWRGRGWWAWDRPSWRTLAPILTLLLLAGYLRLANLGYAEFQGDEVAILHKAAALIQGQDAALFSHKKGPAEILLPTALYALAGRTNEWVARFPFALANLAGLLGLVALGRRSGWPGAGWMAALLIALNGYYVAFGRIVQYQSLVLLMSILGILYALRFAQTLARRELWLAALFLGVGLLAHTDTVFGGLATAYLVVRALAARRLPLPAVARLVAGPLLLGGLLVVAFYGPFVLQPGFATAREYIGWRLGRPPYNNLRHFLDISSVYNAVYYLAILAFGAIVVSLRGLARLSRPRWIAPALLGVGLVGSWAFPSLWLAGGRDFVGLVFAVFVLGLFLREPSPAWRAAVLWCAVPFWLYSFWFRDPRTHLYTIFPGLALLLGLELARLRPQARLLWVYAPVSAVLILSLVYLQIMFVGHAPEYKRTYPQHRSALFWTPYGDQMPQQGLFGFPYRAGWKVIGALYASGQLQGDYYSNEEGHITRWYTRGAPFCASHPRYYALAENVQDVQDVPQHEIEADYELVGQVWSAGRVTLRLYERQPAQLAYQDYHVEEMVAVFDRSSSVAYPTGLALDDPLAGRQHPADLRLGSEIEFLGHSLDRDRLRPGEALTIWLYWRAVAPIAEAYTVFTHIEDPGVVWSQKDHPPLCGEMPTNQWALGQVYADPYTLILPREAPPGPHALVVGMYHADTGQRLAVTDAAGNPQGNSINLGSVQVLQP